MLFEKKIPHTFAISCRDLKKTNNLILSFFFVVVVALLNFIMFPLIMEYLTIDLILYVQNLRISHTHIQTFFSCFCWSTLLKKENLQNTFIYIFIELFFLSSLNFAFKVRPSFFLG